jgi:hypothetical protein
VTVCTKLRNAKLLNVASVSLRIKRHVRMPTKRKATPKKKPEPANKALYSRVKTAAKKKFDVYPSAYANAWLVREYKKRGGTYK